MSPDDSKIISTKMETFQFLVTIFACYRPQGCIAKANAATLIKNINSLYNRFTSYQIEFDLIRLGCNLPDIHWKDAAIKGFQNSKLLNEQFLETFDKYKLTQIVDFPTRKQKILDLLLTN